MGLAHQLLDWEKIYFCTKRCENMSESANNRQFETYWKTQYNPKKKTNKYF